MTRAPIAPPEVSGLRRVLPSEIPTLARVLSQAFAQDPFYGWIIPQDSRRAQRLYWMFELLLTRYSVDLSETYATPALDACAIWKPPGDYRMTWAEQLRAMPGFAHAIGWSRIVPGLKLIEHLDALHARHAPAPHVYLYTLGVDPAAQGRGLGRQLLKPMLERYDAEAQTVYLETANERNVPFYERHGFVLREAARHPRFPTLYAMTRSPQLASSGAES